MLEAIVPLNKEISECLKSALRKSNESNSAHIPSFSNEAMDNIQIIFDQPVIVPCYLLFAIATELKVSDEVYKIISSYDWTFG